MRRTVPCSREAAFAAWTDPAALTAWFGGALGRTLRADVDLRVGGGYRLALQSGDQIGAVEGVYREVEPPERLVFTWRWDRVDRGESLVTVEFRDHDGATEVAVTHEGLETEAGLAFHHHGWTASLERLEQVQSPPVLWHLKASHYNEKARWALDYKGIPHVRRAAVPGEHARIARRLTGDRTLPVLVLDGEAIGDSTHIIEALERRWPEPPLYPADPQERRRALEIEDFFDEELGPYARLLLLRHLLPDPKLLFGVFVPDLRGLRRFTARANYPLLRRRIVSSFGIDEASVAQAERKCRAAGERFAAEVQAGGYLVGDRFTVADLTVAALVSPLVAPEQFPYPQPQRGHRRLAGLRALLDEHGLAAWAGEMYARHRGVSVEVRA